MLKRGKNSKDFSSIVSLLALDLPIPPKYKDHQLKGSFAKFRELHIEPDWLLVYYKEKQSTEYINGVLYLELTGTHSDLF